MKTIHVLTALFVPLAIVAATPALAMPLSYDANGANLSGQYAGTVSDSSLGSGTATADLIAGSGGLGGLLGFTFGNSSYGNPALAGTTRQGLRGEFEATIGSMACRFSFKAIFDRSKDRLRGDYTAVSSGCSGENGTFTLKQQCFYATQGDVRRNGGLMQC